VNDPEARPERAPAGDDAGAERTSSPEAVPDGSGARAKPLGGAEKAKPGVSSTARGKKEKPAKAAGPKAVEPAPAADAAPGQADEVAKDAYVVALPTFEGPLDLLLHLIQKHELDILDIPVSFITEKYLEYLKLMRELTIDVASEYLVMAATLTHIKSKMLLPEVPKDQGEGEEEEELDPRAELVRRLLEYQKYKAAAEDLGRLDALGKDVFPRGATEPVPEGPAPFQPFGVFDLLGAFNKILEKTKGKVEHEVVFDRISITDRIMELTEALKARRSVPFEELFVPAPSAATEPDATPRKPTRFDVVITFLAVLEMCRLKMMRVYQAEALSPIHVELLVVDEEDDAALREPFIERAPAKPSAPESEPIGAADSRDEAPAPDAAKVDAAEVEAATTETAEPEAATTETAEVEAATTETAEPEAATTETAEVEAATTETAEVEAATTEPDEAEEAASTEVAGPEAATTEAPEPEAATLEGVEPVEAATPEAAEPVDVVAAEPEEVAAAVADAEEAPAVATESVPPPLAEAEGATSDPRAEAEAATSDPRAEAEGATSDPLTEAEGATSDPLAEAEGATSDPRTEAEAATSDPARDRPSETEGATSDPAREDLVDALADEVVEGARATLEDLPSDAPAELAARVEAGGSEPIEDGPTAGERQRGQAHEKETSEA
jgi:segregation and condensation protein A